MKDRLREKQKKLKEIEREKENERRCMYNLCIMRVEHS